MTLTERRIDKALKAATIARNYKFKLFWADVARSLIEADESFKSRTVN